MRKKLLHFKTLLMAVGMLVGGVNCAWAQASYNHSYAVGDGVTVETAAGQGYGYFLYNVGAGQFFTGGRGWGTFSTVDYAGKIVSIETIAESTNYRIQNKHFSANSVGKFEGYLPASLWADNNDETLANQTWTFEKVGDENKYTIYSPAENKYLIYSNAGNNTELALGETVDGDAYYWIIVPKTVRDAAGDYTYYLQNQGFNRPWERQIWCGIDGDQNSINIDANRGKYYYLDSAYPIADRYHLALDLYQAISETLPNATYKVYAQAYYVDNKGQDEVPYLFANDDKKEIQYHDGASTTGMEGSFAAFNDGKYENEVTTTVTDGSLRLGIKTTTALHWISFDNFEIQMLTVEESASSFSGAMSAYKWYSFTPEYPGVFQFSATDNITYVTDGSLMSSTAGSAVSSTMSLVGGTTYYFKSTTDQSLTLTKKMNWDFTTASWAKETGFTTESVKINNKDCTYAIGDLAGLALQSAEWVVNSSGLTQGNGSRNIAVLNCASGQMVTVRTAATLSAPVNGTLIGEATTGTVYYQVTSDGAFGFTADRNNYTTSISVTDMNYTILYGADKAVYDAKVTSLDAAGQAYWEANVTAAASVTNADKYATEVAKLPSIYVAAVKAQTSENAVMTDALPNASCTESGSWTGTVDGTPVLNTWSTEDSSTGLVTNFMQYWVARGNTLAANTMSQTISGLRNGTYQVSATVRLWDDNTESTETPISGVSLFANSQETAISGSRTQYAYNDYTATYFTSTPSVTAEVTDGSLTLGIKTEAGKLSWVAFKNFTLTYVASSVSDVATAFTNGETAAAGTWYYYDVPTTAEYYIAAGTDLSNFVCTTDGSALTTAVDGLFSSKQELTADTRVYFKTSAAQTLKFGQLYELADVTGAETWDWSQITTFIADGNSFSNDEEMVLKDVESYRDYEIAGAFGDAQKLSVVVQHPFRSGQYFQGNSIKFHTTVPGLVNVDFSNTGGSRPYRYLRVNGVSTGDRSATTDKVNAKNIGVDAGDVAISGYIEDASDPQAKDGDNVGAAMLRIYKITFTPTKLNGSGYSTFSSNHAVQVTGANAYAATLNVAAGTITCTKIADGKIPAGTGVLLYSETANAPVTFTNIAEAPAVGANNLKATTLADGSLATKGDHKYYVLTGDTFMEYTGAAFAANKAYFDVEEGAATARNFRLVFDDEDAVTAIKDIRQNGVQTTRKYVENGRLRIESAKGVFTAAGTQVK